MKQHSSNHIIYSHPGSLERLRGQSWPQSYIRAKMCYCDLSHLMLGVGHHTARKISTRAIQRAGFSPHIFLFKKTPPPCLDIIHISSYGFWQVCNARTCFIVGYHNNHNHLIMIQGTKRILSHRFFIIIRRLNLTEIKQCSQINPRRQSPPHHHHLPWHPLRSQSPL